MKCCSVSIAEDGVRISGGWKTGLFSLSLSPSLSGLIEGYLSVYSLDITKVQLCFETELQLQSMQLLGFSTLLVLLLGAQSQPRHGELGNPAPRDDRTRKPSKRTLQNFRTLGHFAPANIGTETQLETK